MIANPEPRGLAPASGYFDTWNTTEDLSLIGTYSHVFNKHRRSRLRQGNDIESATIKAVRIYCGNLSTVTSLKIWIWRWNPALFTYHKIGATPNLRPQLLEHQVNEVDLAQFVPGAWEMDYTSVELEGTANTGVLCQSPTAVGKASLRATLSPLGAATSFDWDNATQVAPDRYVQVQVLCDAADIGFLGDSQVAGAAEHRNCVEDIDVANDHDFVDVQGTMGYQLQLLSGYTYQNLGIGGEGAAATASRVNHAVAGKFHACVVQTGWNDVRGGATDPVPVFLPSKQIILNALQGDGQLVLDQEWVPLTAETNQHHITADAWQVAARAQLTGNALWVPQRYATGIERTGGSPTPPVGNRYNWHPSYVSGDGLHPNNAGKAVEAGTIWAILSVILNPGRTERTFARAGATYIKRGYFSDELPRPMLVEVAKDDGSLDTSFAGKPLMGKLSIDEAAEVSVPVINNNDGTYLIMWPTSTPPFTITNRSAKARFDTMSSQGGFTEYLPRLNMQISRRV